MPGWWTPPTPARPSASLEANCFPSCPGPAGPDVAVSPARRTAHADPRRQLPAVLRPSGPGQRRARARVRAHLALGAAAGPSPGRRKHRADPGATGPAAPGPAPAHGRPRGSPAHPAADHREHRQYPASITQALHNYFRVGDASAVDVDGVDGLEYLDKFENYAQPRRRGPGRCATRATRPQRPHLHAGQRPLCPARSGAQAPHRHPYRGSRSLVAWNPGPRPQRRWRTSVQAGATMCLEAANAGPDVVTLPPGGRHVLSQTLSAAPWTPVNK